MSATELRDISDTLDSIIYCCGRSSKSESEKMQSAIACLMDAQDDIVELLNKNEEEQNNE